MAILVRFCIKYMHHSQQVNEIDVFTLFATIIGILLHLTEDEARRGDVSGCQGANVERHGGKRRM